LIPRVIHFAWFGRARKPPLVRACIRSWQTHHPDWEIVEWNEQSFPVHDWPYVQGALDAKKYAFASDVARFYALAHRGGVYLDADVECLRPLTPFLTHQAFTGFEMYDGTLLPVTAVTGSVAGHSWSRRLLEYYVGREFGSNPATGTLEPNTYHITRIMREQYGVELVDIRQDLAEGLALYPSNVFCTGGSDAVTQHHFAGSWIDRPSLVERLRAQVARAAPRRLIPGVRRRLSRVSRGLGPSQE
jgi:hypothetical protein